MTKPTGTSGPLEVTVTPDGAVVTHHARIVWPPEQRAIEQKIFGYFRREFERDPRVKFRNVRPGGTRELDFLVDLPRGQAYIELMEAIVPKVGGRPYQPGQQVHDAVEYAERVWSEVAKKVRKYGSRHTTPVDLLIYTTHQQYAPGTPAIQVLRHYFNDREQYFQYAFLITPLAEDDSPLHVLYSRDVPFRDLPPMAELRDQLAIALPSSAWQVATT